MSLIKPSTELLTGMMMPLPLAGPPPTMLQRKVTWSAGPTRPFQVNRFLVVCTEGRLMTSSIKVGNDEQLEAYPLDLGIIGSPTGFMPHLQMPVIEPGMLLRVEFEWIPPAMQLLMSERELKKRTRTKDWSLKWNGVRLRIDSDKIERKQVPRSTRFGLKGFVAWPEVNIMVLGRVQP